LGQFAAFAGCVKMITMKTQTTFTLDGVELTLAVSVDWPRFGQVQMPSSPSPTDEEASCLAMQACLVKVAEQLQTIHQQLYGVLLVSYSQSVCEKIKKQNSSAQA
jgi:hypothetical protein